MSGDEPSFREKYEWWVARGHASADAAHIERRYAEAHQPRVTPRDVWAREFNGSAGGWETADESIRAVCERIATIENEKRERGAS